MSKDPPTLLKVSLIPVLILSLAFVGWDVLAAFAAHDLSISLGYAVIVTMSLYLDRYPR